MAGHRVEAAVHPAVRERDLPRLVRADKGWWARENPASAYPGSGDPNGISRQAIAIINELRSNPFLGNAWEGRSDRFESLTGCRRVAFDRHGWNGKPRYRLVYRLFPDEDLPELVWVICVERRADMSAYQVSQGRLPVDPADLPSSHDWR